ncbi:MAG: Na+-translocating NADH-quinone reductase subunit C [Elusimicrobiota bacterium]
MRSTGYTFGFAAAVCIACSLVVSSAATLLRDKQAANVRLDIQKNILRSVGFDETIPEKITALYAARIEERVIDAGGNAVADKKPADLDPKKDPGLLPLFVRKDGEKIEAYAFPVSGKGLWSTIYGYMALEPDCVTVKGVTFYQHGETPGLGGEIEKSWFLDNFKNKRIVDDRGGLAPIIVAKGKASEAVPAGDQFHAVDGVSGATLTGKGVMKFLAADLKHYDGFFRQHRAKGRKQ